MLSVLSALSVNGFKYVNTHVKPMLMAKPATGAAVAVNDTTPIIAANSRRRTQSKTSNQ